MISITRSTGPTAYRSELKSGRDMKKLLGFILAGVLSPMVASAQQADRSSSVNYFGDWRLNCFEQDGMEQCLVTQAQVGQNGAAISVINVSKTSENSLVEFVLPLMTDLTKPVELKISENEGQSLPYSACNQSACFVLLYDTDALLAGFKANTEATMEFDLFSGQRVNIKISLRGFTAAYDALMSK